MFFSFKLEIQQFTENRILFPEMVKEMKLCGRMIVSSVQSKPSQPFSESLSNSCPSDLPNKVAFQI